MKAEKERGLLKVNAAADWRRKKTCQVLGLDRDSKRVGAVGKDGSFPPGFFAQLQADSAVLNVCYYED